MVKIVKKEKTEKKNIIPNLIARQPKKMFIIGLAVVLILGLVYFSARFLLVASVNGQLISRLTVLKELEKQGGKKTLDDIILKALINQEANKRKITVGQKEVDAEIQKIEANVTAQGLTLDQLLQQQGMKKSDFVEVVRIQLLVPKMVGENINVTDKEVDNYLAGQKAQSSTPGLTETTPAPEMTRDQAKEAVKQQKLLEKIQTFVADLKAKAKINYFINY